MSNVNWVIIVFEIIFDYKENTMENSMKKREQFKRLLMFVSSAILLLGMTLIFSSVWLGYYVNSHVIGETFYRRGNYVVIAIYAVMLFLFYRVFGALKIGKMRIFEAMLTQILSVLAANAMTYLQLCLIGHWSFLSNVKPMLWLTVGDLVLAFLWVLLTRWIYVMLYPPRKLLAVCGQYSSDDLIHKMSLRKDKYAIEETISIDCDIDDIKRKICEHENVLLADIPDEIRNKLLKFCFEQDIRCYALPKISDIMIKSASEVHIFDTVLLLFRNNGLTWGQKIAKRLFDVVVSGLCLVILSPIMLLIALAVKLYDGGPVFFSQKRLTENGRPFDVYKFRSMRVQRGDEEYCMTRKNDDRITPVGKILRNIHFDELPQLWNIFKGDMSFVGPRPECPDLAEEYGKIIPEFKYRLKMKAGLTGYAQVFGKYNTTPYDKLKLDLTYIKNYSFWLDMKLLLLTVKILFQKENTEGIDNWQKTAATKDNLEKIGKL